MDGESHGKPEPFLKMDDLGENPIFGNTYISPNSNTASFWGSYVRFQGCFREIEIYIYIGKEPLSYSQSRFASKMF